MTPQEFKAWFEGFTEAFGGVPTKAQWARVKERVAEIDGKPVTERHYIDRYYPSYPPYYWQRYGLGAVGQSYGIGNASTLAATNTMAEASARYGQAQQNQFNSTSAMAALGRADAMALKN